MGALQGPSFLDASHGPRSVPYSEKMYQRTGSGRAVDAQLGRRADGPSPPVLKHIPLSLVITEKDYSVLQVKGFLFAWLGLWVVRRR